MAWRLSAAGLLVLGLALALPVRAAAPPARLTAQQKKKLAERDRLWNGISPLSREKQYDKVIESLARIAALDQEVFGETHPRAISSLRFLLSWHRGLDQTEATARVSRELLRIQEKRWGKDHWEATDARLALEDARRAEKMTAAERAQLRQAETWDRQSYQQPKAAAGLPLAIKARDVRGQLLGEGHPTYAASLARLAQLHWALGDYAKALPLYQEALRIRKKALGEWHPLHADTLSALADLHRDRGEEAKALALHREALRIRQEALGEEHGDTVRSLISLAGLYRMMGEHARALPLYQALLRKEKESVGDRHPDYAHMAFRLAELYRAMGEHDKALPLYQDALAIRRRFGESLAVASSLNGLASLYLVRGDYEKALPLSQAALKIRKKELGEGHPDYANNLNSLGVLYDLMGEYEKALPLHEEALRVIRKTLGERHPHTANSLANVAGLHLAMGKPAEAAKLSGEALAVLEGYLDEAFDQLGERQRNQFLQNVLKNLSAHLSHLAQADSPASESYAPVLSWKGRVSAWGELDRLVRGRAELKGDVERLQAARARLSRLTLQTPPPAQQAAWLKRVQALTDEKERLEADLSHRSAAFRARKERKKLTPEQLAKGLPAGVAFVDLIEYTHFSPAKGGKGKFERERRLLAFVSLQGKEVVAVPLGAQPPVADAVARWRAEVEKDPRKADRKAVATAAGTLREKVWRPLTKHLGGAKTVVVAPDGVLCQFPLAALPGGKEGTYLIEELAVAQVGSAAQLFDLLEPADKDAPAGKGLLALGGVDYGAGKAYDPLPGTGPEATRCRDLFRKAFSDDPAALLTGKDASAAVLRKKLADRPRYLHLATHGYFEPPDRVARLLRGGAAGQEESVRQQTAALANLPGLRCGLALSGANRPPPSDDPDALPGLLTGQDVEGLDLRGCEVAVLSACQTGLGDLARSQGVLGLQRAFHAAGAKTLVTSLWSVQDAATAELMEEFYSRLWGEQKVSRIEALRQAQLAVLRDPERVRKRTEALLADAKKRGFPESVLRGPKGRYATDLPDGGKVEKKPARSPESWWAAFVLSGDWR